MAPWPPSTTELHVQEKENARVCHRLNAYRPLADTTSDFGELGSHEVHFLLLAPPLFPRLHLPASL